MRVVCTGDWAAVDPGGGDPRLRADAAAAPYRLRALHLVQAVRGPGPGRQRRPRRHLRVARRRTRPRAASNGSSRWPGRAGAQPLVVLTKADLVPDADALCTRPGRGGRRAGRAGAGGQRRDRGGRRRPRRRRSPAAPPCCSGSPARASRRSPTRCSGADVMDVQAIRDVDGKGRHTTTTRNLLAAARRRGPHRHPGAARRRALGRRDRASGRSSPRSRSSPRDCRFHDCAHGRSPGARCWPRSRTASCRSAAGQLPQAAARERLDRLPDRPAAARGDAARVEAAVGGGPGDVRAQARRRAAATATAAVRPGARPGRRSEWAGSPGRDVMRPAQPPVTRAPWWRRRTAMGLPALQNEPMTPATTSATITIPRITL